MPYLAALVLLPAIAAVCVFFARTQKWYARIVRLGAGVIMLATVFSAFALFSDVYQFSFPSWYKLPLLALEIAVGGYIIYRAAKGKAYLAAFFALAQICITLWFELFSKGEHLHAATLYVDKLSWLLIIIAGIIGSLICVYAVEYMKDYHRHHPEVADKRNRFFAILFVFLSAMFGLVMCNSMSLMLFFWEITSLCSFLLIGYTKTAQAIKNAFQALTINVGGGLAFTIGITLLGVNYGVTDFQSLISMDASGSAAAIAVMLLATAGLTKSAQMPFSEWLVNAMVAPTPTSAMLHSSTMVKAGVYLIIRLAPMLGGSAAGATVTAVGGITFLTTAIMAVSQSDAKKILAYSTISNLGLIVACAGTGTGGALWAAIMLIVFHAIAKSLLFLTVGSTEHQLGSRNVEDMDGLYRISTALTMLLVIGIAGMFIAPFGMLVAKWAAVMAFVDSGNILSVMLVAFGSSVTLFFWTKWLGKLLANAHHTHYEDYVMRIDEKVSLYTLGVMVIIVCVLHPVISNGLIIPYINSNLSIDFVSPISSADTSIIILMMCLLFVLPIILIPLYKNHAVKPASVYLSGENTGDNESFFGSMGQVKQVELRNWYFPGFLDADRWGLMSQIICLGVLVVGFFFALGGGLV